MKKTELRNLYSSKRASQSPESIREKETRLFKQFLALPDLKKIAYIHRFIPISEKKEVNVTELMKRVRAAYPEIIEAVPRVVPGTGELQHIRLREDSVINKNNWGILEPVAGEAVDVQLLDAVIVPLLCFDLRGHRVGYGAGYYDRFLVKCRPDCRKIGLSFFDPVDWIEDVHDGDMRLDLCVTPQEVFDFSIFARK